MGDANRCYARNDMIRMRDLPKSRTRPIDLSEQFDNEDGLFSPDKWLQHRWQCEGVESRPTAGSGITRKKTSSRAEEVAAQDLETIVLSPQRRGFFSGCRAPSPKITDDEKTTKARWRQNLNNGSGVDFKPFFQKNVEPTRGRPGQGNSTSVWRNNTNDRPWNNDKPGRSNRNNNNFDDKTERLPEWVDEGPSSMTDIIELKGFDDDVREKKKRRRNRDSASKSGSQTTNFNHVPAASGDSGGGGRQRNSHSNSTQGSRPSSRLAAAAGSLPPLNTNADMLLDGGLKDSQSGETATGQLTVNAMADGGGICLPNSDAEFAALLGILDIDPTKMPKDALGAVQANQPSSSRFSRFFCKNSTSSVSEQRPLFDNFNQPPTCKSPRPPGAHHGGPMFDNFNQPPTCKSPRPPSAHHGGPMFNRNYSDNVPAALKELFSTVPPRPQTPNTLRDFKESMTVEELERDHVKFHHMPPRSPMLASPLMNPPHYHNAQFADAAAASAAKLAAMQAIAPPNEQFMAAFHQHMQQQLNMALMRGDLAAAQAMRSRPMFDNFNQPPTCKSPRPPSAHHGGPMFNRNYSDNVPAALKELFSTVPPRPQTPNTLRDFKESMTVEELERDHVKFHHMPPRSPMLASPLMNPPPYHNAQFADAAAASAAKLAAMQAIAPPNEQFLAAFHQHMQQHFQRMATSGTETAPSTESGGMPFPATKFPFDGRQPPQYDARSPSVSSLPFVPTSVMRQLSAPPTGFNSTFIADQQQLNMAIMRGDLTTAQAIRARMLAHVQTMTGLNGGGGGGLNPYQE